MLSFSIPCPQCGHCLTEFPVVPQLLEHSSDLQRALDSNEEPHPDICTEVSNRHLNHEKTRFSILESIVLQLSSLLIPFQDLKQESLSRLTRYAGVVNPLRRLPTEILQMIFYHVVVKDLEVPNDINRHDSWRLSRVCTRWRDTNPYARTFQNDIITADMDPCGSLLSVQIEAYEYDSYSPSKVMKEFKDVSFAVCDQSDQWKHLQINADSPLFLYAFQATPCHFNALDSLHLNIPRIPDWEFDDEYDEFANYDQPFHAFAQLPRLNHLSGPPGLIRRMLLPFHQIQSFTMPYRKDPAPTAAEVLDCLRLMPQLETFSASFSFSRYPTEERAGEYPQSLVTLPSLRFLTLSREIGLVLPYLTLPALESCKLDEMRYRSQRLTGYPAMVILKQFFERSSSNNLRHVVLKFWDSRYFNCTPSFKHLSSVRNLEVGLAYAPHARKSREEREVAVLQMTEFAKSVPSSISADLLPHLTDMKITFDQYNSSGVRHTCDELQKIRPDVRFAFYIGKQNQNSKRSSACLVQTLKNFMWSKCMGPQ